MFLAVSPPTRGWTSRKIELTCQSRAVSVSPPTRGWTHQDGAIVSCWSGFPRPRGDGPWNGAIPAKRSKVSPPTRGWTLLEHGKPHQDVCDGFPRPRGDGPGPRTSERAADLRGGFPAHAGMDPAQEPTMTALTLQGFPAHAGMDPSISERVVHCCSGFPRPRGDGPVSDSHRACSSYAGFPAHAGMDPCPTTG